jgi:hypothetical protein
MHLMRSKEQLQHISEKLQSGEATEDEFLGIDLDDIDADFLSLILDALEHYELYRLCLIICNRYGRMDKVGRYLVSISHKYSNLKMFRFELDKLNHALDLSKQQKYSALAHEAIHNVLSVIDVTKLQEIDVDPLGIRENSFDQIFLGGYHKKLLFLLDSDSALQLAYATGDFTNFKLLYLVYKKNEAEFDPAKFKSYLESEENITTRHLGLEVLQAEAGVASSQEMDRSMGTLKKLFASTAPSGEEESKESPSKKGGKKNRPAKGAVDFRPFKALIHTMGTLCHKGRSLGNSGFRNFTAGLTLRERVQASKLFIDLESFVKGGETKVVPQEFTKHKQEVLRELLIPFKAVPLKSFNLFARLQDYAIVRQDSPLMNEIRSN